MNAVVPIVLFSAVIGGIALAAAKSAAAEDLKIDLDHVEFDPFKNIYGGVATATLVFAVSNIHKTGLTLQAIDLDVRVDGKTLATIQDFNPRKIGGVSVSTIKLPAKVALLQATAALGMNAIKAFAQNQNLPAKDRSSALKALLPKNVQVIGNIRAEGTVIQYDETTALKV